MKLRELFDQGIGLQGDEVVVKEVSKLGILFGVGEVVRVKTELAECNVDSYYLDSDILYIYQQSDQLVIEIEKK